MDKKSPNPVGKLRKKTERSFDEVVDRKVVDKRSSIKNLLTQWETEKENRRLTDEAVR